MVSNQTTRRLIILNIYLNGTIVGNVTHNQNLNILFDATNKVEDEIRGYLVKINNNWEFVGVSEYKNKYNRFSLLKVALILESPHKDEFTNTYVPIRPANGKTGNMIEKRFAQVPLIRQMLLANLTDTQCCEIYVMNPVQHQCSCANYIHNTPSNRAITDKVFRMLFRNQGGNLRQDFINRLMNYCPSVVINACTSSLKGVVKTAISHTQLSNNTLMIDTTHPSVW